MSAVVRTSATVLLLLLVLSGASTAQPSQATADSLVFTGRYRMRMQVNGVQGSVPQYRLDTGLEPGTLFTQGLALSGFGPLDGGWYLNGRYDTDLDVPDRLELRINKAANELFAGTRRFSAPSPGLLQWGRLLTGIQASVVSSDAGRFGLRAAAGDPLGIPAREELTGKGLVGPYLLASHHIPVVSESEKIWVDNAIQQPGDDYEIDYELGGITFSVPVPESSKIVVEYEYEAPQPRRTGAVLGRWKEGNVAFDILAGYEHAVLSGDGNPLDFIPPDGEEDTLPTSQHMEGAALSWSVSDAFNLTGSWLGTTTDTLGTKADAAAWQLGGEWNGMNGRAGWDWRVVPAGFRPIGKSVEGDGYRALSAGYEYNLTKLWHSKLNMAWKEPGWQTGSKSFPFHQTEGQMEHVLTYARGNNTLGWSLGLTQDNLLSSRYQALTTGAIGTMRVGKWDLEAEQRIIIAGQGTPSPGKPLSSTRVSAKLVDHSSLSGSMQWKQDLFTSEAGTENATVWRAILAGKSGKDDAVLPDTSAASWRIQMLSSAQEEIDSQENRREASRLDYGRAEATLPLGRSGLTTDMLAEIRKRSAGSDSSSEHYVQAGLRYSKGIIWSLDTAMQQVAYSVHQPDVQQLRAGAKLTVPFLRTWTYNGGWQAFQEDGDNGRIFGAKQGHGISWHSASWRLGVDWTTGLLEEPATPGDDDDDEEDEERPPLSQVPVGQRYGISMTHTKDNLSLFAQIARDIEQAAGAWHSDLRLTAKVGTTNLVGEFNSVERRGSEIWSLRQSGKLGAQWWIGQTLLSIDGRTDVRIGEEGIGDYRSNGVFAEWSARF